MTELTEDVVLQIASPHVLTAAGGAARGAHSGSVELGRRLLVAARLGHTAQVLELMAKGAPFTTDWLGTSPLHLAAAGAHADTCAVLLRAGVSRDSRTKVERTPLHLAAHAGHATVAALLLAHGAAVDCRDLLRMTPLHWACERGYPAVAAVLLRHGADPHARSKFRKTPRGLAAARGHRDIVALVDEALLERARADAAAAERRPPRPEPAVAAPEPERTEPRPEPRVEPAAEPEERGGAALAAALLREHGITLLPPDPSSTVLNALHSGRTVVLSDAGKLMLKESGAAAAGDAAAPKPGVKIFKLAGDAAPKAAAKAGKGAEPAAPRARAPVKIIVRKAAPAAERAPGAGGVLRVPGAGGVLRVPAEFLSSESVPYLRAQLLAAHRTIHALSAELAALRRAHPPAS